TGPREASLIAQAIAAISGAASTRPTAATATFRTRRGRPGAGCRPRAGARGNGAWRADVVGWRTAVMAEARGSVWRETVQTPCPRPCYGKRAPVNGARGDCRRLAPGTW